MKLAMCCVCLIAGVLLASPVLAANTVTLQQGLSGYAGCKDAWLDESLTRHNNGGAPSLRAQWNNGRSDCIVMKFDLTGVLPAGATVTSATLSLWFYDCGSLINENYVTLKPYRLQPSAWWDENVYDDVSGFGVSYRYRDANELYEWTGGAEGGWYDKLDDANGVAKFKKAGGTPPDAVPPQNWLSFDVTPSVVQWVAGATNNGFLIDAVELGGSGSLAYGLFISRNDSGTSYRPKLTIQYDTPVPARSMTWSRLKQLYR
jgi:hypothetical protein